MVGEGVRTSAGSFSAAWTRHKEGLAPIGCALFLVLGGVISHVGGDAYLAAAFYVLSYLSGGTLSLKEGVLSLVRDRRIDVDLLMVLAAVAAASIGEWIEGGILLFLFSLSNALQSYAMDRTRRAITALMSLRPQEALLKREDGTTEVVAVDRLEPGDVVVVLPGELIPIDGKVVAGVTSIDESSITGESIPIDKRPGDEVFGGTINQYGSLDVRVAKRTEETVIAKIIRMVEEAQSKEAPTQRKIDTIEQYYAAFVIALTIAVAVIPFALGVPWSDAVYRAITLMVVASPCAVAMAAPAPIVASIANAARSGILFKGGVHVENMAALDVIAFDKTGTLTEGTPVVTDVVPTSDWDVDKVLSVSAAVEKRSEHPLATAIVTAAEERGIDVQSVDQATAIPGEGIVASVDGEDVWIGNRRLAREKLGSIPKDVEAMVKSLEEEGKTAMYVGADDVKGLIAVVDRLRPGVPDAIKALKNEGVKRVVMLTGDNESVAAAIAARAGIDEVHAGLLPGEKAEWVDKLRGAHGLVAMVGDGVNDAPALARSTIGVAMGARGSDVALETADVVLMTNDLGKLVHALRLSRRTQRIIWQNLVFALGVIGVLAMVTLFSDLVLAVGVVGHEGSTVLVILNSLRLLWGTHRSKSDIGALGGREPSASPAGS